MSPLTTTILEQKRQRRQTVAQLPYPEKVRIVETLREASLRIAAAAQQQGLRKPAAASSAASEGSQKDITSHPVLSSFLETNLPPMITTKEIAIEAMRPLDLHTGDSLPTTF